MTAWVCVQCGTQFADTHDPPSACRVCEDDRQYVRWGGQAWTDLATLAAQHRLERHDEDGVVGIGMTPPFAIGQRALIVPADDGRFVLWDCVPLVTDDMVVRLRRDGGLAAIAISHPHYYAAMVAWSQAFGGIPIYLHADDAAWIMRSDPAIVCWTGETHSIAPGLTLIRTGGHFPGATVLHAGRGAEGRGALFGGDVVAVAQDRRTASFMHSFPNQIPLDGAAIRRIAAAVAPFAYDRLYGAFRDRNIRSGAKAAVDFSLRRYLRAIGAEDQALSA